MDSNEIKRVTCYHLKESMKYTKNEINQLEKNIKLYESDVMIEKQMEYMQNIQNHLKEIKTTMGKTLLLIATQYIALKNINLH